MNRKMNEKQIKNKYGLKQGFAWFEHFDCFMRHSLN